MPIAPKVRSELRILQVHKRLLCKQHGILVLIVRYHCEKFTNKKKTLMQYCVILELFKKLMKIILKPHCEDYLLSHDPFIKTLFLVIIIFYNGREIQLGIPINLMFEIIICKTEVKVRRIKSILCRIITGRLKYLHIFKVN